MNLRIPAFLLALGAAVSAPPALAADAAIAWQGKGADGNTVQFDPHHLKRPAILLFWATWCPYCRAEMPYVQKVYDAAGRNKLDVYAIDIKDDGDPLKALHERKQTFTLIRDGDAIAARYGVKGTPALFLVDVHGNILYRRVSGSAPAKLEADLREKLGLPTG